MNMNSDSDYTIKLGSATRLPSRHVVGYFSPAFNRRLPNDHPAVPTIAPH
jgi:hypothetical protein